MLNIATLAVATTAALHLKSTTGELLYADEAREKPVRIILHTPGSKAFGAIESRQTARAVKRMNENDGKLTARPSEEIRAEQAEDLAAITVAFENFDLGEQGPQGAPLFEAVYNDPALGFIVKQVTKFLADWANFKLASAAN